MDDADVDMEAVRPTKGSDLVAIPLVVDALLLEIAKADAVKERPPLRAAMAMHAMIAILAVNLLEVVRIAIEEMSEAKFFVCVCGWVEVFDLCVEKISISTLVYCLEENDSDSCSSGLVTDSFMYYGGRMSESRAHKISLIRHPTDTMTDCASHEN